METFGEMTTELAARLQVADNSTLFPTTRLKSLLNQAYIWAAGIFPLPETEDAKKTSTAASQDYYDYPEKFYTDSVYDVVIDGYHYNAKAFEDFRKFIVDNPNETNERMFATHGRQYFVFPVPTTNGTNNMEVFGNAQPAELVEDGDFTVFSHHTGEGNEAVVKKAYSVAVIRTDSATSVKEEKDALGLLSLVYQRKAARQNKYQRKDKPQFDIPDYFPSNSRGNTTIGNFTYRR